MLRACFLLLVAIPFVAAQRPSPFPEKEKLKDRKAAAARAASGRTPPSTAAKPSSQRAEKPAAPPQDEKVPPKATTGTKTAEPVEQLPPNTAESGVASFCGPGMDGRPTATGELYDSNSLSGAHARFPLGSQIKVTNLANGKSVTVRVNDRIRSSRTVIVLTRRAAEELDFVAAGSAQVKLEPAK